MHAWVTFEDGRELHVERDIHTIEVDWKPVLISYSQPYYWLLTDGIRTDVTREEADALIQILTKP